MRIRAGTAGDRAFVRTACARFAEFELPQGRSADEVNEGTARRVLAALDATSDRSAILIAQDDAGEPLGFVWVLLVEDFFTREDVGKVSEIAVVRDGTGAGRALLRACEEWAAERGCRRMVLNVFEHNDRARHVYESLGYFPEHLTMSKLLGPAP